MVMMACKKSYGGSIRVGLYEIGDVIGEGNFATVRYARHRHTNSDVSGFPLPSRSTMFFCIESV